MLPIYSIRKESGPKTLSWTVGNRYVRINEEWKLVRLGTDSEYRQIVYRVYDKDNNIVVEIESCSGLVITYAPYTL